MQNLNTKLRLKPSSKHHQLGCRSMVKEAPSKYCFGFRGRGFTRPLRVTEQRINEALIGRTLDNDAKGYLLIKDISQLNGFLENSMLRLPDPGTIELLFEEYTLETLVNEMGWPEGNCYYQEEEGSVEKYNFSETYEHSYFIFVYEEY